MNNNTIPVSNLQEQRKINFHKLDMISVNATVPLISTIYQLSDTPIQTLSYMYKFLRYLNEQNREQEIMDVLFLIYSFIVY